MKIRTNYVSNSSSSSFLVSKDVSDFTPCIKLSEEIWKNMEKYYIEEDGTKFNLSELSHEWWLTTLISDSDNVYDKINEIPNSFMYLSGNDEPYDWYDDPKSYTVFKKNYNSYYIKNHDLFGYYKEDVPSCIEIKNKLNEIIKNSHLNKSQKINAIKSFLDI